MDTNYRNDGKLALSKLLSKKQNIDIIEKNIYNSTKIYFGDKNIEENYRTNLFQIIGDIINKLPLKDILNNIKTHKIGWEHTHYNETASIINEQNEFIKNPFEVEEGVFQCNNCGSRRVYSYSRQDRSCDEGTSVYAQCVACKSKWRERG